MRLFCECHLGPHVADMLHITRDRLYNTHDMLYITHDMLYITQSGIRAFNHAGFQCPKGKMLQDMHTRDSLIP